MPVGKTDKDEKKATKLEAFRRKAEKGRLVQRWRRADDLALAVIKSLKSAENSHPRAGWIRGDVPSNEELLAEIRALNAENTALRAQTASLKQTQAKDQKLNVDQKIKVSYLIHEGDKETKGVVTISLKDVISEFSLMETLSNATIEECVQGAVSVKVQSPYENTEIPQEEIDKVAMLLAREQVISLRPTTVGLLVEHGQKWLIANAAARFGS